MNKNNRNSNNGYCTIAPYPPPPPPWAYTLDFGFLWGSQEDMGASGLVQDQIQRRCLVGAVRSISRSGGGHGFGVSISSLGTVSFHTSKYYQLEMRGENLEEDPLKICGELFSFPSLFILVPMVSSYRQWLNLIGDRMVLLPWNI